MSEQVIISEPGERIIISEVGLPGAPGADGVAFEIKANKAAIDQGSLLKRFIYVLSDEDNNGDTSLYVHNGTTLKFLQTIA